MCTHVGFVNEGIHRSHPRGLPITFPLCFTDNDCIEATLESQAKLIGIECSDRKEFSLESIAFT